MKSLLTILSVLPLTIYGQFFQLSDTVFKTGDIFRTYRINYECGQVILTRESEGYLDTIVNFLDNNKGLLIEVGCFEHPYLPKDRCILTTYQRAQNIKSYLVSKGISAKRIVGKGYGGTRPLVTFTEVGKIPTLDEQKIASQKNIRTEIKILKGIVFK